MKTNRNVLSLHNVKTSLIICSLFLLASCDKKAPEKKIRQQVLSQTTLQNVRLADGIPLDIKVSTRWEIEDQKNFYIQFGNSEKYDSLVLFPKELELANAISIKYNNVDSVFTTQRHHFISTLKSFIAENLGEEGVKINEVIIADVRFPQSYTDAKERLAMQDHELERIRKQSLIDLEATEARKKQTSAQGEVDMAAAIMTAKVEKINAETEESRRKSMLAKAETDKQVSEKRAEADARRRVLMSKADLEKMRDLKNLEIQKQRDLNQVKLENENNMKKAEFENDMRMAKLCNDNPIYAKYMVNKELASKVKIAVVPTGEDGSVFSELLD